MDLDITILAKPYRGLVNRSGSDQLKKEEVATIKEIQEEKIIDIIKPIYFQSQLPTEAICILFGRFGNIMNQRPRNTISFQSLNEIYSSPYPPSRERDKDFDNVVHPKPSYAVTDRSGTAGKSDSVVSN